MDEKKLVKLLANSIFFIFANVYKYIQLLKINKKKQYIRIYQE